MWERIELLVEKIPILSSIFKKRKIAKLENEINNLDSYSKFLYQQKLERFQFVSLCLDLINAILEKKEEEQKEITKKILFSNIIQEPQFNEFKEWICNINPSNEKECVDYIGKAILKLSSEDWFPMGV